LHKSGYDTCATKPCLVRSSGVAITVSMRAFQLDVAVTLPDDFHTVTLNGLFGNFNGDPFDDLVSAYGEKLDSNSSDEEAIYRRFGETCKYSFVILYELSV
jgi:hypothetical protein